MWRRFVPMMLAATALTIVGNGSPARAQGEAEPDEDENRQPVFALTAEQFDLMAFGRRRGPQATRRLLESLLRSRIEHLDHLYKLTKEERGKLELAGRGDI